MGLIISMNLFTLLIHQCLVYSGAVATGLMLLLGIGIITHPIITDIHPTQLGGIALM